MNVTVLIYCWNRYSCSVRKIFWMPDQNGDNGDFDHAFFVVFELTKTGLDQIFVHVFG